VCPGSNIALGVYAEADDVPLTQILDAGIRVALGADDPLLFGNRLTHQYEMARDLGCSDPVLADLARGSILASRAPEALRSTALRDIDGWLADEPEKSALPV
jgi:adenosine deaminase